MCRKANPLLTTSLYLLSPKSFFHKSYALIFCQKIKQSPSLQLIFKWRFKITKGPFIFSKYVDQIKLHFDFLSRWVLTVMSVIKSRRALFPEPSGITSMKFREISRNLSGKVTQYRLTWGQWKFQNKSALQTLPISSGLGAYASGSSPTPGLWVTQRWSHRSAWAFA